MPMSTSTTFSQLKHHIYSLQNRIAIPINKLSLREVPLNLDDSTLSMHRFIDLIKLILSQMLPGAICHVHILCYRIVNS